MNFKIFNRRMSLFLAFLKYIYIFIANLVFHLILLKKKKNHPEKIVSVLGNILFMISLQEISFCDRCLASHNTNSCFV